MKRNGYTLIELLATLSVIAILTGFALPGFSHIKKQIEADVAQQEWMQFLNKGRSAAVTYESTITACPLINNVCVDDLNQTWVSFTDPNKNKKVDSNEIIIYSITPAEQHSLRLYPKSRNFIRFYSESSGIYSGLMTSLTVCTNGRADEYASHIRVNVMGRVSATQERDADGVPLRKVNSKWERITC